MIEREFGQPCYVLANGNIRVSITVQGGHLRASFPHRGGEANPFFLAPWWNEAPLATDDPITQVLRGDFFCLPFGGNADPYLGVKYGVHGITASGGWELLPAGRREDEKERELALSLPAYGGEVRKRVRLDPEAAVLYCEHRIAGIAGRLPGGHHAVLQFPAAEGSGRIDLSEPVAGFTFPEPLERPAGGGYSLLQPNVEIADRTRVPTVYGDTVDLTRYPLRGGHEDVVQFVSDTAREFCFSSVTFAEEGYLFFQLKDPRVLSSTLMWRSNGGRHYAPWSGRVRGALGLEEVTSYFAYGPKQSAEPNPLSKRGWRTCLELDREKPTEVRLIMGLAAVPAGFTGVRDITRDGRSVLIHGQAGERLRVPCRVDFLQQG
jgi:hypothetical protein